MKLGYRFVVGFVVGLLGCGGADEEPPAPSGTGGSTSQGVGGAGGGTGGSGGEEPVDPGTPLWTAEITTQFVGGSRFAIIGSDVAEDGRAYALSCSACPESNLNIGDLTIVDGQGETTVVERNCSPEFADDAFRSCHVLAFDDDGTLASAYGLEIRPTPKDAFATPDVSVLSLQATPDGVSLDLRVVANTVFEATSEAGTVVSSGATGRLHLELAHGGQERALTTHPAAPARSTLNLLSCAAYTPSGQPQFEATFPLTGAQRIPSTRIGGGRCLALGSLRGPGATVAGQTVAASETYDEAFIATLDANGQGPVTQITADDDVYAAVLAGYEGGAAFAAKAWMSTEMRIGELTVAYPRTAPSVVVGLDTQGQVLHTSGFVAENGPPLEVAQPAITGLALDAQGRLAFCGRTNGTLREVSGGVVVDDFDDRVKRTPYLGEIDPDDGRVAWIATPVTGDVITRFLEASSSRVLFVGFIDEDGTAQVGDESFANPYATLITSVAW